MAEPAELSGSEGVKLTKDIPNPNRPMSRKNKAELLAEVQRLTRALESTGRPPAARPGSSPAAAGPSRPPAGRASPARPRQPAHAQPPPAPAVRTLETGRPPKNWFLETTHQDAYHKLTERFGKRYKLNQKMIMDW